MIYEKLNHYLIFIILSQLFLLVNRIVYGEYIPGPRAGTQAVIVNNKIYYIGGYNSNKGAAAGDSSDVFYYDNGVPLSPTGLLPWVDLGSQVKIPSISWHSASLGGTNQKSIFIMGGARADATTSLVYQFDTETNAVSAPAIKGTAPPRRESMDAVSYEGKIYIFSGVTTLNDVNTVYNNFDILNTITMTWEIGSLVNAPIPRFKYTATLVGGVIYYIGGIRQGQVYEPMSNIYQYDIASNTWSLKTATAVGPLPQDRASHTAVVFNGKIYIYGGIKVTGNNNEIISTASQGTMVLLDIATLQWSTPLPFVNTNSPKIDDIPKLVFHTASLIENRYMFIAFGNVVVGTTIVNNNDYYKFDLEKLQWIRLTSNGEGNPKYPPPPVTSSDRTSNPSTSPTMPAVSPVPEPPSLLNTTAIIGLSTGLAVVGLGAIAAFIFVYRHMKKKNQDEELNNVIGMPSESMSMMNQSPTTSRYPSSYHSNDRQFPGQEFATLPQQERYSLARPPPS